MAPIIPTITYSHNIPILPRDLNITIEALNISKAVTPSKINTTFVKDTISTKGTTQDKRTASSDTTTCSWGILDIFCNNKKEAYSKSYGGTPLNATHSVSTRFIADLPGPKEPLPSLSPSIIHGPGPKEPIPSSFPPGKSCEPDGYGHHSEPITHDFIPPCVPGEELACHTHHPHHPHHSRSLNADLAAENARVQNFLFIAIVVALIFAMFAMGLHYWRKEYRESRWFAQAGRLEGGGKRGGKERGRRFESVEKEEEEEEEEEEVEEDEKKWRADEGVLAQNL